MAASDETGPPVEFQNGVDGVERRHARPGPRRRRRTTSSSTRPSCRARPSSISSVGRFADVDTQFGNEALTVGVRLLDVDADETGIEDSERAQRLLDPAPYELDASLRRCRAGAEERRRAAQRLPGLFNNCRFFLHGDFSNT